MKSPPNKQTNLPGITLSSDVSEEERYGANRRKVFKKKAPKTSTPRIENETSEESNAISSDEDEEYESAESVPPVPNERTRALRMRGTDRVTDSEGSDIGSQQESKAPPHESLVVSLTSPASTSEQDEEADNQVAGSSLTEDEIRKSAE